MAIAEGDAGECRYCGAPCRGRGDICSKCAGKLVVVHKFLKAAREFRELLDRLEKRERLKRQRKQS